MFDPKCVYGFNKNTLTALGVPVDGVFSQYKMLPSYGVTAWNSLYGSSERFVTGQTVLMLGAGGVSINALICAKAAGAVTTIISSSGEKLRYVKEKYGADYTINYKTHPGWEKEVLKVSTLLWKLVEILHWRNYLLLPRLVVK
ncbi:MAG: hypothetical protein EXX96DRAFT_545731 [Benjaminiella poitrasii]|nr:MAG: hypothetical protein EXX96DRAFT_545731 [Benjaminiella poitrasii]